MWQRMRQFRRAETPPAEGDLALAEAYLAPALLALFRAQHAYDIRHAAAVARWLLERGHTDPQLLAAALLHDTGKGLLRRSDRVAWVAAGWVGLARPLGNARSCFELRRAAHRLAVHAAIGADAIRAAGGGERVAWLVEKHHSPPAGDGVLALLQQADAAN